MNAGVGSLSLFTGVVSPIPPYLSVGLRPTLSPRTTKPAGQGIRSLWDHNPMIIAANNVGKTESLVMKAARECFERRGNSPRINRNAIMFLAPDRTKSKDLLDSVAAFLSWKSIYDERERLGLDPHNRNLAEKKMGRVRQRLDHSLSLNYVLSRQKCFVQLIQGSVGNASFPFQQSKEIQHRGIDDFVHS